MRVNSNLAAMGGALRAVYSLTQVTAQDKQQKKDATAERKKQNAARKQASVSVAGLRPPVVPVPPLAKQARAAHRGAAAASAGSLPAACHE
jgi:hypothetical protein